MPVTRNICGLLSKLESDDVVWFRWHRVVETSRQLKLWLVTSITWRFHIVSCGSRKHWEVAGQANWSVKVDCTTLWTWPRSGVSSPGLLPKELLIWCLPVMWRITVYPFQYTDCPQMASDWFPGSLVLWINVDYLQMVVTNRRPRGRLQLLGGPTDPYLT